MIRAVLFVLSLALAAFAPVSAFAQAPSPDVRSRGVDPVVAKLSPSAGSGLTIAGARLAPAGSYQLDAWLDYHAGLLSYRRGDDKLGDLLAHRLDVHLMGALALTDAIELALDLPLTAWQAHGFDDLAADTGFADAAPASGGLGDVRLLGRAGLLRDPEGPVLLALIVEARLPSGNGDGFLGERSAVIAPRVAVERTLGGDFRLALEAGYRHRFQPGQYLNLYVGDELTAGLSGSFWMTSAPSIPTELIAELALATPARAPLTFDSADALKTPLEALVGVRAELSERVRLAAGVGRGVAIEPGYGRPAFRAFASVRYEVEARDEPPSDRDGDGVLDVDDQCPDEPGLPELDGCPDRDQDAIPDIQDRCPDDKGVPKFDGCPPDKPVAVFEDGGLTLFGTISFDSGKATLKPESFPVVDEVAQILDAHPEIGKIRVDGHTDDVGSAAANQDLSRRRAAAVVEYLVEKGIASGRLSSEGFGESTPIADNGTALGRAKNRRVEFVVLESDGEPVAPEAP